MKPLFALDLLNMIDLIGTEGVDQAIFPEGLPCRPDERVKPSGKIVQQSPTFQLNQILQANL
jgi:hypothetical protein